jgi:oligosaccharyltransferase complex subunit gamma
MILVFTSGYMWNKIKNAPYVNVDRDGKVSWIAAGFQNQLGLESQIIAGICKSSLLSLTAKLIVVKMAFWASQSSL